MSPQESQARELTLQNAVQAGQLGQQQLQEGALDLQQKRIEMQDQATMRQAYMDSGGNMQKFQTLVMQRGASPKAIAGIQQQILANQEGYAKRDEMELKNANTKAEAIGRTAQTLLDMPDDATRTANWPSARMQMLTQGHAAPSEIPEQYPGQDYLTLHRNAAVTTQESIANASKARTVAAEEVTAQARKDTQATGAVKQAIEGPGQQATADQLVRTSAATQLGAATTPEQYNQILGSLPYSVAKQFEGKTPAQARALGMTPDQQTVTAQTAIRDANTEADRKVTQGQGAQRLSIEADRANTARVAADPLGNLGINKSAPKGGPAPADLHGEAFLATLAPPYRARVQAISRGAEAPLTGLGASKGEGAALMAAVEQYDPTWTKDRAKIRSAFAIGPDGRNIGALNTATVHMDQLHEAAKAMNNGTFQPGNQAWNYVAQKFGAPATTNYAGVMNALAGEVASALKGNATDPEIAHVMSTLGGNLSPQQAEGIALTNLHVLGAKLQTYNERYHAQAPDDPWTPVLPSARAVYTRYGIDPTAAPAAVAPAGTTTKNPFRK